MYIIGLRPNDNTTFSQKLQESLPQGTSAKRPNWPPQSQFIQHSSKVIVQIQSYQSILPASFSTGVDQFSQLSFSLKSRSINYWKKKATITKGFTAWAQPTIPPLSLNSVLIKNSNSIPQGFAFRPAVSLAPSLKEIATPDESAWSQSLPNTQTFDL